ncbi:MAG: cobalamin-dependent protein [Anaerolineae bacterium]|nr:cobalamin-dependent protein [Anaerolineae bacterium]
MRVLLVEPPKTPWLMMGDVVALPLGLAQLAGCLEEAGIGVEVLDANALDLGLTGLGQAIGERQPDLIGMTAFTPWMPDIARAVRVARQAAPQALIAVGGPHVTFTVEETLDSLPELDIIARGEGERIIVPLARAVEAGDGLDGVPGISFRRDGQVVETAQPAPVDPRTLPLPAFHLLPMERYYFASLGGPFATILASRGCPFHCTFCSEWPFWRGGWRPYDPEHVVEQLDIVATRYGRTNVWFGDDCFNVDGDHLAAICEGILERGIELNWYYQGRADLVVKHKELLPLMRRAGNRMVQLGIEASNDEQRRALNKQLETAAAEEAIRLLRANDIVCQAMMIVGLRDDSPKTFEEKVRFVKKLDADFPVFLVYTLFPGAQDYGRAIAEGWIELPANYAHHDMAHVLMPTEHMSRQQIWNYTRWAWTTVYLDPIKLARNLFSRNQWRRQNWRGMLVYIGKQTARNLVPRFW